MNGPAQYVSISYKWSAARPQPHSRLALKSSDEEKSSQQAKFQGVHMVIHFVCREKTIYGFLDNGELLR